MQNTQWILIKLIQLQNMTSVYPNCRHIPSSTYPIVINCVQIHLITWGFTASIETHRGLNTRVLYSHLPYVGYTHQVTKLDLNSLPIQMYPKHGHLPIYVVHLLHHKGVPCQSTYIPHLPLEMMSSCSSHGLGKRYWLTAYYLLQYMH